MGTKQSFGGPWTIEKLNILSDYLNFYVTALKNQPFDLIYIDAFAGTGHINLADNASTDNITGQMSLLPTTEEAQEETIAGSATLALKAKESFSHYYFIEKKKSYAAELEALVEHEFPNRQPYVDIIKGRDCNDVLLELCEQKDWRKTRGVLLLDPYAADVKWETLIAIANTHAIDVWYLFPFSVPIRMMAKDGNIDPTWKPKLNSMFGDNSWEQEFYEENPQINLFGTSSVYRNISIEKLKSYIEKRLGTLFSKVSPHSRVLYNSKKSPLFMFCFAVSNPDVKAQGLALKVANYILKNKG